VTQQPPGHARILGSHEINLREHPQGPQGDIFKVAYRGGDNIEPACGHARSVSGFFRPAQTLRAGSWLSLKPSRKKVNQIKQLRRYRL
jgi:hypothetical protein